MRAIDADAFAEFLKDAVKRQKYEDIKIDGLLTVADVIEAVISELEGTSLDGFKNAPTIELRCEECEAFNKTRLLVPQTERKKGEWISKGYGEYRCSSCRNIVDLDEEILMSIKMFNYCPVCGADMMEDQDGKND